MGAQIFPSLSDSKLDALDIKDWLKNPVDFITLPSDKYQRQDSECENSATFDMERGPFLPGPAILISMSYLPTTERLSLIILKVRLNFQNDCEKASFTRIPRKVYVKAYLIDEESGRRTSKKKTSLKSVESFENIVIINFNELMIFPLPINFLTRTGIQISVTGIGSLIVDNYLMYEVPDEKEIIPIGSILVSSSSSSYSNATHFNSMVNLMRKPVTMWHLLH